MPAPYARSLLSALRAVLASKVVYGVRGDRMCRWAHVQRAKGFGRSCHFCARRLWHRRRTMSTKDFGCFCCSGKSIDARGTCPNCGAPIDVSADLLSAAIGEYRPKRVLGRGFYGWTLQVEDQLQAFPLKVLPQSFPIIGLPDAYFRQTRRIWLRAPPTPTSPPSFQFS